MAITLLILRSWWFIYIRRLSLLERVWGGRRDRGGKNVLASALVMVYLQEMADMFLCLSLLVVVNNNNNTSSSSSNNNNNTATTATICLPKVASYAQRLIDVIQSTNDSTMLTSNERKY